MTDIEELVIIWKLIRRKKKDKNSLVEEIKEDIQALLEN